MFDCCGRDEAAAHHHRGVMISKIFFWTKSRAMLAISLVLLCSVVLFLRWMNDDLFSFATPQQRPSKLGTLCISKIEEEDDDKYNQLEISGETYSKQLHVFYIHQLDTGEPMNVENFRFFMHFAYVPCSSKIFFTFLLTMTGVGPVDSFSKTSKDFNRNIKQTMKDLNITNHLIDLIGQERVDKLLKCMHTNEVVDSNFARANTKIFLLENRMDLCSVANALRSDFWTVNEALFRYIFFINSSIRGPFLPVYYYRPWWEMFTDTFRYYPNNTVAVGPYISAEARPHVQSFLICVNQRGLEVLKEVYRCKKSAKEPSSEWIIDTEVRLGPEVLRRGYAIRSFLSIYGGLGTAGEFVEAEPNQDNPTVLYPLTDKYREAFQTVDNAEGAFAVNVFETVWVKFNRKFPMTDYTKMYVPMYTSFMYRNLRKRYYGRDRSTYFFEEQ